MAKLLDPFATDVVTVLSVVGVGVGETGAAEVLLLLVAAPPSPPPPPPPKPGGMTMMGGRLEETTGGLTMVGLCLWTG